MMKVLFINGSPHEKGNTYIALQEMDKIFAAEKIDTEIVHIGNKDIRGCIACRLCAKNGKCVFDDAVNAVAPKFEACDGLVVGSPVYYASANATLVAFLTRLFYSTHFDKTMKVGAAVVAARRGGLSSTFDELNKFFTISGMPVASGQYWNSIHGREAGEAERDADAGKEYGVPDEKHCARKRPVRHPGKRTVCTDEFYSLSVLLTDAFRAAGGYADTLREMRKEGR